MAEEIRTDRDMVKLLMKICGTRHTLGMFISNRSTVASNFLFNKAFFFLGFG